MIFVIHWHESVMDLHVFPIPIPPPTSLSTRFLCVFPVHQAQALVSCIQPRVPFIGTEILLRMGHCPMSFLLPQLGNRGKKKKTPMKVSGDSSPWISWVSAKFTGKTNCPFVLICLLPDCIKGKPWKTVLASPHRAKHGLAYCPV